MGKSKRKSNQRTFNMSFSPVLAKDFDEFTDVRFNTAQEIFYEEERKKGFIQALGATAAEYPEEYNSAKKLRDQAIAEVKKFATEAQKAGNLMTEILYWTLLNVSMRENTDAFEANARKRESEL